MANNSMCTYYTRVRQLTTWHIIMRLSRLLGRSPNCKRKFDFSRNSERNSVANGKQWRYSAWEKSRQNDSWNSSPIVKITTILRRNNRYVHDGSPIPLSLFLSHAYDSGVNYYQLSSSSSLLFNYHMFCI